MLDANLFDEDGNIIATVVGDRPYETGNFASDLHRLDEHSLWATTIMTNEYCTSGF